MDHQDTFLFNRERLIQKMVAIKQWDLIVIGGGATGLGIAIDAANRGFKTLLLEQADFAKGTSSRSTKLVHGGVRYLAQGAIGLVYEALRERGLLLQNAPHLVKLQPFIIPCYNWWQLIKYYVGLKLYDWLSGTKSLGASTRLKKESVVEQLPTINSRHLVGGILYYDGQFDDARLAINLAQTCIEEGGVALNYFKVTALQKDANGKINGVTAIDVEQKKEYALQAKTVVNATGVFVDNILKMDQPKDAPLVTVSQGAHLVVAASFLGGQTALMIPETSDGRVLFAVPWKQHVLLGTTDTPLKKHSLEPSALQEEIQFILQTIAQYLTTPPGAKDVLSVFAGLRPLAAPDKNTGSTKEISRSHKIIVSRSGLITIIGGKWTTYRKMAEDTVNKAIETGGLSKTACNTRYLKIHGYTTEKQQDDLRRYGSDEEKIKELTLQQPELNQPLVPHFPYTAAEVVWAVRYEMARTVEDVLARRLRLLFLDATAAIEAAPLVAQLMAKELNKNEEWEKEQVAQFIQTAKQYKIPEDTALAIS